MDPRGWRWRTGESCGPAAPSPSASSSVGAVVGALLLKVHIGLGLLVPALISIAVAIIGHRMGREAEEEAIEPRL